MSKIATREAYGKALVELGAIQDIVVMDADLSKSTKTELFSKTYPDRFINTGIAEANMISAAAGIASTGKTVFVSTFAMFAAGRAYEQIRNSIAYTKLNVKICASHGGITVGEDGGSHQCIEDFSLMRTLPGMVVINPADAVETRAVIMEIAKYEGPVYVRLGRLAVDTVFDENDYKFEIGKGKEIRQGSDVTIIATGFMVGASLEAASRLADEGISARVINMPTIKPIDRDIIVKAACETGAIVTCEEHNIIGGLGSAVAEVLAEDCPTVMERVGILDIFGRSGAVDALIKEYGLTADDVIIAAKKAISRKK